MSISAQCASCGYEVKVGDEFAGRRARCPQCSGVIVVPAAAAASVEARSTPPAASHDDHDSHDHDDDDDHGHDDHEHDDDDHGGSLLPHKDHPHEDLIDMTPMVDIVFFLLIFFLTTSMTALQAVMNLPNPQKATEGGASRSVSDITQDSDSLKVVIHEDDTFWVEDEQVLSDQDLRMRIRQAVDEAGGKPLSLVVIGSSDATHGAAIRVFDAGASAGVGSISLLVKEDVD
jgi:biopolymer transport protein ExbD